MEKVKRPKKRLSVEPPKLTRAEKVALRKKQDRAMYCSFAPDLRGYAEDHPVIKNVKFTCSGANITFEDGTVE